MRQFYTSPTDMEPLLPADQDGSLADLGWQVVRRAERLGGALHPVTARGLAGVVQVMNSYYTHLIEGHQTTPADLQAVLARVPAGKPKAREIQQLHLAHLRAQEQMERDLESGSAEVTSTSFLLGLHRHFYEALPTCARNVQDGSGASHAVEPGCLRDFHVSVGQHLAPHHEALPQFLSHFAKRYAPEVKDTGPSLVACAAAHHRLVWIHPFADGNGRVARLFSQAWHQRSGVHAHGLWSISRGLARNLDGYRAALAAADEKRRNDTDGRGYLSAAALTAFCRFYLETCMDQLDFMAQRLEVDALLRRVHGATEMLEATGDLPKGSRYLLTEALLRGEMPRGDAARLIGKSPRTAQSVIRALLDSGHLTSPSEKGVLRLGFPRPALTAWLPGLFG